MADAPDTANGSRWRRIAKRLARALRRGEGDAEEAVAEALSGRDDKADGFAGAQKDMILNAARFYRLRVGDVMTPRADIVALEVNATLGEAARLFAESQHSRLPIYRETLDDPLGLVHVKDVLPLLAPLENGETKAKLTDRMLARLRREILFVPASMTLPTLLLKMQTRRIHLALVVDEYGGTDGILSIEDIIEQIVGDIADEYDEDAPLVAQAPGGAFEADGRASIEDVEKAIGASLSLEDEEIDTVGGLAMVLAGRLPQRGEILHHPAGFDVEILESDPRRVKRVRIKAAPPAAQEGAAA